jgi:hypothetical protein
MALPPHMAPGFLYRIDAGSVIYCSLWFLWGLVDHGSAARADLVAGFH